MKPAAGPVEGVLFDVDETLYDRERAQRLVLDLMRDGLPDLFADLDPAVVDEAWHRSDRETEDHVYTTGDIRASRNLRSALFLRLLGLPEAHADAVTDFYLATYPDVPSPVAGAAEAVDACGARLPVGVVSNAFPDAQYRKLEAIGLRSRFHCIVLSEEFGARKPDPAILLHGCHLLGVEPARCLYVGDSFAHDVVGARAAGMLSCWYNPRRLPVPARQAPADAELRHLGELPLLLAGWGRTGAGPATPPAP